MDITLFLQQMVEKGASDLFFSVGCSPQMKVGGNFLPLHSEPLTSRQLQELTLSIMKDQDLKTFESTWELNSAISVEGVGRFRINIFRSRGEPAMVLRYIKGTIPSLQELSLPTILHSIICELRGLVLVVGGTGSGKSTTLASMIDHRNQNYSGHILLIEDPIEFMHQHKKSVVNQREVGIDTLSFENALFNAMREAPDVIAIGEIRDRATMKYAIAYAETGHLCLATLHANNANQALDRIINFFPEEAKPQLLLDLSLNLKSIISLRLVPSVQQKLIPAVEILLNSPYIADRIEKGKIEDIKDVMAKSKEQGMQTFDQALLELYHTGNITAEDAIRFADSKNNVGLDIRLNQSTQKKSDSNLKITPDPEKDL